MSEGRYYRSTHYQLAPSQTIDSSPLFTSAKYFTSHHMSTRKKAKGYADTKYEVCTYKPIASSMCYFHSMIQVYDTKNTVLLRVWCFHSASFVARGLSLQSIQKNAGIDGQPFGQVLAHFLMIDDHSCVCSGCIE